MAPLNLFFKLLLLAPEVSHTNTFNWSQPKPDFNQAGRQTGCMTDTCELILSA